jgi:hypothetical protein
MKRRLLEGKKSVKSVLTAAVLIGASTLLFQNLAYAAANAELSKANTVPTSYVSDKKEASENTEKSLPEGYKHAEFKVSKNDLEYYQKQSPTSKDITMEEAAEICAQTLWEIFKVSLKGQEIRMGYAAATESLPRSNWNADVYIDGVLTYHSLIDSITGEILGVGQIRTLKGKVSVAFDKELDKNPQEYLKLAEKTAEKLDVVHGKVKSVEYNGQGYSNNDPTISVDITGENGEIALMTFSRYDKALLGIEYNNSYKPSLEYAKKKEKEMQKKLEELKKKAQSSSKSDTPGLIIYEEEGDQLKDTFIPVQ